jgi:hypothetical protein
MREYKQVKSVTVGFGRYQSRFDSIVVYNRPTLTTSEATLSKRRRILPVLAFVRIGIPPRR